MQPVRSHGLGLLLRGDACTWVQLRSGAGEDGEAAAREEVEATEHSNTQRKRSRKVCNALSECVPDAQPSSLSLLLDQVRKLEQVVGYNCNPTWASIWNKIEIPLLSTTGLARTAQTESFESLARLGGLSGYQAMSSLSQKRLAINGRSRFANLADAGSNQFVYSHRPHRFERCAFSKPTNCYVCRNVLWGFAKTDMKCSDCNFSCHNKCAEQASNNCTGFGQSKKQPLVSESQAKMPPPSSTTTCHQPEWTKSKTLHRIRFRKKLRLSPDQIRSLTTSPIRRQWRTTSRSRAT